MPSVFGDSNLVASFCNTHQRRPPAPRVAPCPRNAAVAAALEWTAGDRDFAHPPSSLALVQKGGSAALGIRAARRRASGGVALGGGNGGDTYAAASAGGLGGNGSGDAGPSATLRAADDVAQEEQWSALVDQAFRERVSSSEAAMVAEVLEMTWQR